MSTRDPKVPPSQPVITVAPTPKKGSGEHPAMAEALRRIDATSALLLPELKAATERLGNAVDAATEPPPPLSSPTIGLWVFAVRGIGPHHNQDTRDIERITAAFVLELHKAGHRVEVAHVKFDDGRTEDVSSAPESIRSPKKKEG